MTSSRDPNPGSVPGCQVVQARPEATWDDSPRQIATRAAARSSEGGDRSISFHAEKQSSVLGPKARTAVARPLVEGHRGVQRAARDTRRAADVATHAALASSSACRSARAAPPATASAAASSQRSSALTPWHSATVSSAARVLCASSGGAHRATRRDAANAEAATRRHGPEVVAAARERLAAAS
eukprot:CAMPEP_0119183386 /NCGR_PEP_ID=MMETSP1315-20130426/64097_1 /TAXON_ID=676789 /ORGANISM="Prasinoderma singularis, Strain RCC927" /LENGTH=183 /DNA_ID=CAMNT_0007177761 /DNA_START=193 /DNA_END=742 /DNA_ORIENTATION=-